MEAEIFWVVHTYVFQDHLQYPSRRSDPYPLPLPDTFILLLSLAVLGSFPSVRFDI